MKPLLRIFFATTMAMLMVTGAMAQTKTKPPTAPKNARPANPRGHATTATSQAKAPIGDKFWGTVTKDPMKDNTFKFGSADKKHPGKFTVDAKTAKVVDKAGKAASLKSLTPGSTVTIYGTAKGLTLKANKIEITFIRKMGKTGSTTTSTRSTHTGGTTKTSSHGGGTTKH